MSSIRKSGGDSGGQKWESRLNHVKYFRCSWKPREPRAAQDKRVIYVRVNMCIPTQIHTRLLEITRAVKRMDLEVSWTGQGWMVVHGFVDCVFQVSDNGVRCLGAKISGA